ncbi:MAG: LamG domain-containing protein, partial [bacterium]|nr:LamG domain-containing protein [bacterium]
YNLYRNPDTSNLIYPTVKSILLDHGDYALDFDGSDDYVNCGNDASLKITGNQTYEFWIKPINFSARRNPINKAYGGEGTITIETNGALSYYWGISGVDGGTYQGHGSTITIAANTWTHVAHVRDVANKTMVWYFNGVANNPIAPAYNAAVASANNLSIGKGYAGPIYGQMDEVRIYARVLTAAEVLEHSQGIYKNETELRGIWHFNEGSGTIASDSSGKGNNGSLINMSENSWKFPLAKPKFIAPLYSNTTYKYKIKAMGVDTESGFSNEVIVNTGACLTAPVLINNDICSYYNKPITLLYWPNQKNITAYKLYKDGALFESKAPADYISSDGFIKHWLLIGGFSYAGTDAAATLASLNTDYLGGELKVKPRAGESVGGKIWFDYNAPTSNYTDFTLTSAPMSALTPKTYASAYAFAYVYSPIAQTVQLRIGSDDGVKAFLNGSVIYTNNTQRGASPDQDIKAINLLAGINTLLIKVQQGASGWGLYARITDSSGNNVINNITTWDSAVAFGDNLTYNIKAKILDEETDFSNSAVSTPPNCQP